MENDAASQFDSVDLARVRRRRGAKWNKFGPDVLAAWVADMDFGAPPPIRQSIERLLEEDDYGYPWLDPNPVVSAFVHRMSGHFGWRPDPEGVRLTGDVLQSIQYLIDLYTEPGDGIVLQTPIYPPFLKLVHENNRRLVDNPLKSAADGYGLDVDQLAGAIDDGTKLMLLCNPHNPTGHVFREDELRALGELAVERDLIIITDEIHADLIYPTADDTPLAHLPIASLDPRFAARTFTLTSATKAFNIAGLRLAVASCGTPELADVWDSRPKFHIGGTNTVGAMATVAAWTECDDWLSELVIYLDGNRRFLEQAVADFMPGVAHVAPESTYLAWLDCTELIASGRTDHPHQFFLDHGVAMNDGRDFGDHGHNHVRINFATSRQILSEVVETMATALG